MRAVNFGRNRVAGVSLAMMVGVGLCAGSQVAMAKPPHVARHHQPAGAAADTSLLAKGPDNAATSGTPGMSNAEKLRRLDIMLLVTGLRCRSTVDDFQTDFQTFETRHRRDLNFADHQLRIQFGARRGSAASAKAMDHINVEMANVYGNGHPWMGCHDLKGVVHDLADMKGTAPLLTVADQLLASPKMVSQL